MGIQGLSLLGQKTERKPRYFRLVSSFLRFLRAKPLGGFGAILVFILILVAVAAPLLAPYDPVRVRAFDRLQAPSQIHWFGTDELGRDVLSRVIWGARVSLYVATFAVVVSVLVSTGIGVLSGYLGGRFDALAQRIVDAIMAFPFLILMMTIMFLFGRSITNLAISLGTVTGIRSSRVIRANVLSLKENQYVDAAKALGASQIRIMLLHILPNSFAPIMVLATLTWGNAILAESSLSFLGFGVPPPNPSWGAMVSGARRFMESSPWMAFFPGLTLSLTVFGFNMLGDALRDVLDPRLRK